MSERGSGTGVATLVVMRHGESAWTDKRVNRFAGWVDVELTARGRDQAAHAGQLLAGSGIKPDVCHTSLLQRSIVTADIALGQVGRLWVPVTRTWRLNERHYGAFQGQTRPAMLECYGEEAFRRYRRAYDVRPPEIDATSEFSQTGDPRYGEAYDDGFDDASPRDVRAESLADLGVRLRPWWEAVVEPELACGLTVLVVTHGSVVRSIRKSLEGIGDDEISGVNVPTGVPLAYEFSCEGGELRCLGEGRYLDEDAAARGIAEVSALGGK